VKVAALPGPRALCMRVAIDGSICRPWQSLRTVRRNRSLALAALGEPTKVRRFSRLTLAVR